MKRLPKLALAASIPTLAIAVLLSSGAGSPLGELRALVAGENEGPVPVDPDAPSRLVGPVVNTYAAAKSFRGDLRDLPQFRGPRPSERPEIGAPTQGSAPVSGSAAQLQSVAPLAPSSSTSFDGLDFLNWGAGHPADPNGDVGPNNYIVSVNTALAVYDKSGNRQAAFTFNRFFQNAGVTDACANVNYGDPYVLYDRYSGRWFISDFAFASTSTGPYYQCIAVSKTSDPVAGGWWMYTFLVSNTQLNDYPKFASWQDGIYMTANLFSRGSSYYGAQATVFNRSALVSGAPLTSVSFVLPYNATYGYPFSLLAANDVSTAATGPEYLYSDWSGLRQWTFTTNWSSPGSSTLTGPINVSGAPGFTSASSGAPQPGTTTLLDQLGDRLMSAAQWTNASGNPAVWLTRTVSTSAGPSGILWMQLRTPGNSVAVNQSGVLAPGDGKYRYMASLAVNSLGTMAVGYSTSSGTAYPSLAYAARSANGASGTLDIGEGSLVVGTGSQTTYKRWGDYYSMSVDPSDGCSFWMTGSYMKVNGGDWQTRIAKFAPLACVSVSAPTAALSTFSGQVGSSVTITGSNFLPGATTVSFNGVASSYVTMTSSTTLTAVVPTGATTGNVIVTNPTGSATAGSYTIGTTPGTTVSLTVTKNGTGTVTSNPAGINCGTTCTASFSSGTSVTLTAAVSAGWKFTGWTGACTGIATTCTLTLSANSSTTATFKPIPSLSYTGPASAVRSSTTTLSATLTSGATAISGVTVTFGFNGRSYTGTTNGSGVASVSVPTPKGKGNYAINLSFAGNATYADVTATGVIAIQ